MPDQRHLAPISIHGLACAALLLASACATPQRQLDRQTAAGHKARAAEAEAAARSERQQFDPKALTVRASTANTPEAAALPDAHDNPTTDHLEHAADEDRHARAHREAAARLLSFEAAECRGVEAASRAACPMLGHVSSVIDIAHGVRLEYRDSAELQDTLARMRCHLAYARARGFGAAGGCPLYLRGVLIVASKDGRAIDITDDDEAAASELRVGSRQMIH